MPSGSAFCPRIYDTFCHRKTRFSWPFPRAARAPGRMRERLPFFPSAEGGKYKNSGTAFPPCGSGKTGGSFYTLLLPKNAERLGSFPPRRTGDIQKSPPLKREPPPGEAGSREAARGGVAGRKRENAEKQRQNAKNPAYMLAGSRQDRDRSASHAARFPSAVSSPPWRNPSSSSAATASRSALGSGSDWRSVPR